MINTAGKNLTLQMSSAAGILSALKEEPGLPVAAVADRAGIAEARAISVCSWLSAAGWLERNRLTAEGHCVLDHDATLGSLAIKALLLARLVQRITTWSKVVNEYLYGCVAHDNMATPEAAMDAVCGTQHRTPEQIRKDVGRVFSMLERDEALGSLGIVSRTSNDTYLVRPFFPPATLVGYMTLTDCPDPTQTIPFGWLSCPGAPFRVFLLTGASAVQSIDELERSGLITSERAHNFNRFVVRQGLDPSDLLRRAIYDSGART